MNHVSAWNRPFVFDISYTSAIAPDKNNAVGIGERGMLHAFSYSGKHFYCIDASKGWQESPYALKSDLSNFVVARQISADVTIPNGSPYSTSTHDITCDIPSGYKYVGILRAWCIDQSCFVWNAYFRDEGKNAKIDVSNLNGTQKNTKLYISVLYAKS